MSSNHGSFLRVSNHLNNGSDPVWPAADAATNYQVYIDDFHHETHEGDAFHYGEVFDQALNEVIDIQITTPNTTEWAHMEVVLFSESELEYYFYENVTINTPGTAITPMNRNRNSANTSSLTLKHISNTSIANANADTAVAGATTLSHGYLGSGVRGGGQSGTRDEWILKQNEDYSFRFIASVAGFFTLRLDWYEHTNLA